MEKTDALELLDSGTRDQVINKYESRYGHTVITVSNSLICAFKDACQVGADSLRRDIDYKPVNQKVNGICKCGRLVLYGTNYCSGCGQKLNWGD